MANQKNPRPVNSALGSLWPPPIPRDLGGVGAGIEPLSWNSTTSPEWLEWSADPEIRAAGLTQAQRHRLIWSYMQTIVAFSIEPEGPRRLFGMAIPDYSQSVNPYRVTLEAAINRVVELIGDRDIAEELNDDFNGVYVAGAVLRDVVISLGGEMLAIIKHGESGLYVIRLARTNFGHDVLPWEGPLLEDGHGPGVEHILKKKAISRPRRVQKARRDR